MFWSKRIGIGKLHIALTRNDTIAGWIKDGQKNKTSFHFNRLDSQFFTTIRIGVVFLNIDWV